jgi:hypothetical protein
MTLGRALSSFKAGMMTETDGLTFGVYPFPLSLLVGGG